MRNIYRDKIKKDIEVDLLAPFKIEVNKLWKEERCHFLSRSFRTCIRKQRRILSHKTPLAVLLALHMRENMLLFFFLLARFKKACENFLRRMRDICSRLRNGFWIFFFFSTRYAQRFRRGALGWLILALLVFRRGEDISWSDIHEGAPDVHVSSRLVNFLAFSR